MSSPNNIIVDQQPIHHLQRRPQNQQNDASNEEVKNDSITQSRTEVSFDNNQNRSSIAMVTNESRNVPSLQTDSEFVRSQNLEEAKLSQIAGSEGELPVYESREQYEQALIENRDLRLKNIEEQLQDFLRAFVVHFVASLMLLMQLTVFPELKIQVAVVLLILLSAYMVYRDAQNLLSKSYMRRFRWAKSTLMLRIAESGLMVATWVLVAALLFDQERFGDIFPIIGVSFLACLANCFCIKYEETPCNATIQLMSKIVIVLRFLLGFSVLLKIDEKTQWDWSTTFWPYWCSFAIQGIMAIASFIVFLNTLLNYMKEETSSKDVLASLWAFMVCGGFVASTLAPIIKIIQIFDDPGETTYGAKREETTGINAGYDAKMVPIIILQFPLCYTFTVSLTTLLFRQHIINWFEHVLYIDEEESRHNNAVDDEHGQSMEEEVEESRQVHIRTYQFRTPQFIKKLTNTYFKKSKKEEKQRILNRVMLKQFEETTKGKHKKTKSDGNFNAHFRDFSSIDHSYGGGGKHKAKKPSKFKQDEEFLEFPQEEEEGDQEVKRMQKNRKKEVDAKRFMSHDYKFEDYDTERNKSQRVDSILNRMSISLTQKECCICFDDKPDAVIMECGHGGICYECAKQLISVEPRVCHLCREGISYVLKMDLGCVYSNFFKVISATFVDDESEGEEEEQPHQEENQEQSQAPQAQPESQNQSPSRDEEEREQAEEGTNQGDGAIYFLQNPFLMAGPISQQEVEASGAVNDIIAFVSPRPDEGEGNEAQICEELKEEEKKPVGGYYKFQDEKSIEGDFDSQRSNELVKQVHNRFNLLQLKVGNDANHFYKLESVSNPDSVVISARSSRLDSTRRKIQGNPISPEHHSSTIRHSIVSWRDNKEGSQRIKIHSKQNKRGQSKILVEEFFSCNKVINMDKVGSMIVKQNQEAYASNFE